MQVLRSLPATGTIVEARGQSWRVARSEPFARCALVTLHGVGAANLGERLGLLTPFDRLRRPPGAARVRCVPRHACLRRAARALAEAHPWSRLWTADTARLELLPWQLEPALAVLDGASRLLLADGVGLGKTVQAGLVLAELQARGLATHALVLTPAGLRRQWLHELRNRFGIAGVELDQPALARATATLPVGANPWAAAPVIVSSIDLVKRPEHAAAVAQANFDVLIVDEAHHVTPGTDRGALVARLARRSAWTILVTATPHSGDQRAFAFLHALGATDGDALAIFRRAAHNVARRSTRRSRLCAVTTTDAEQALATAVEDYARAIWKDGGATNESARLVATVVARRAASSAAALLKTLERRRLLRGGESIPAQPVLPWDEPDERDDVEPDALLRVPGLADAAHERSMLDRLVMLAEAARGQPSKARWIARWLRRTREPAIVFSEYRDTVEELARTLPLRPLAVLHGGLTPGERRQALARFLDGRARVLLTTDAAGEGLNLQRGCRVVINAELPWNPVRLEQRVGRVDRLGQSRTVHAVHLFHRDTIEARVLARLHRRVARAAAAGGQLGSVMGTAAIRAVADAAIGSGAEIELPACALSTRAVARAGAEADRLACARRLQRLVARPGHGGDPRQRGDTTAGLSSRKGVVTPGVVCLFESPAVDARGGLVGRYVAAVDARLRRPLTRANARQVAKALAADDTLQAAAHAACAAAFEQDRTASRRGADGWLRRWRALLDEVERAGPALFQASLFDRRATSLAEARAGRRHARLAHLASRIDALEALLEARLVEPPRLVTMWQAL